MIGRGQRSVFLHPRHDGAQAPPTPEWIKSTAETYDESFRAALVRTYGWTDLHTRIEIDRASGRVVVRAHTPLRRIAERYAHGLRAILGTGSGVVVSLTTAETGAAWHVLREPVSRLWRDASMLTPATELLRCDGPVQLLARTRLGALVRGVDGAAGWTCDPLGDEVPMPPPSTPRPTGARWGAAARSFAGVPYRIGGTTRNGVDCSGLVQRLYRDVLGVTIPRHSRDQFSSIALRSGPRREGQLVFVGRDGQSPFRDGQSPFHVGVVLRLGRGEWSVLHASSARGAVVEDAYDDYVRRGGELLD